MAENPRAIAPICSPRENSDLLKAAALRYRTAQAILLWVGARYIHWCQLNVSWAVETAATQPKPACAG